MNKNSEILFEKSKNLVPGGVHSPVRSFKGLPMTPRFFTKGEGAYLTDVEGKNYIDFCMSFGPLILGHQNLEVKTALTEALGRGWSFGACEPYSLELAELLTSKLPWVEQIRFVNSGTEAVMTAIRLARGYTGKDKIIKFDGCYHGHVDSMLIKAGSGLAGEATSSSAGVPESLAKDTLILDLDDEQALDDCFAQWKDQIAAVIIEPLPANNGLLPQRQEYLETLAKRCREEGVLLIFDEVISGFRMGIGGMAETTGITPDIVTYGKIIGGGLPVGALGARKEIMQKLAPLGPVYQAGTLSANPLAMVGGLATLNQLNRETYKKIDTNAEQMAAVLNHWLLNFKDGQFQKFKISRQRSLFWIAETGPIRSIKAMPADLGKNFAPLFSELLARGIYLAPNAYEVGFVSLAHDQSVIADLEKRLWA